MLHTLNNTHFTLISSRYRSVNIEIEGPILSVQVQHDADGSYIIQQSLDGVNFADVPDTQVYYTANTPSVQTFVECQHGARMRIAATTIINSALILSQNA